MGKPRLGGVTSCSIFTSWWSSGSGALLAVIGEEPAEIDDTLRAAAEWARETMGLEFARLREDGVILTGLRVALEDAVRAGEVVRKGGRVRRE